MTLATLHVGGAPACIPVLNSPYAQAVLADSPRLYWQLQDCETGVVLFIDSSGNGFDADAQTGGPILKRQPGALTSSGDVSCRAAAATIADIQINQTISTATDDFSVDMWLMPQAGATFTLVFFQGAFANKGWSVTMKTATRAFRYNAIGVGTGIDSSALSTGVFHHIAVVRDAGIWKYYIDGVIDVANAGNHTPNTPGPAVIQECGSTVAAVEHVALYETALSAAQVAAHYAAR